MGRTRLEHVIEYLRGTESRYLIFAVGGHAQVFAPDTSEWFAWLATIPSFHFQGKAGQFSARQERKERGTTYWYAYRKVHNQRLKRYLGTTATLTLAKLEETASRFHEAAWGAIGEDKALNARLLKPAPDGLKVGPFTVLWHEEVLTVTTPTERHYLSRTQAADLLSYLYDQRRTLLKQQR